MTVLALGRLRLTLLPVYRALADCERQGCRALPRPCPRVLLSRTNPQRGRGSNIGSAADLKTQGRPVRSLGTHRVMHPPAASKSQNICIADLHRLAGPLPPSVRLPSEGWSAGLCCDGCNVKRRLKYVNRLGLVFLIICRPDSLGAKNRLVGGQSINCLHMLRRRCNIAA